MDNTKAGILKPNCQSSERKTQQHEWMKWCAMRQDDVREKRGSASGREGESGGESQRERVNPSQQPNDRATSQASASQILLVYKKGLLHTIGCGKHSRNYYPLLKPLSTTYNTTTRENKKSKKKNTTQHHNAGLMLPLKTRKTISPGKCLLIFHGYLKKKKAPAK